MTKVYKTLAVTLAVMFSVSIIGKNYVVKAEPVTATISVAALSVCVTAFMLELAWEAGQVIGNFINEYNEQAASDPLLTVLENQEPISNLSENVVAEAKSYLQSREQQLIADGQNTLMLGETEINPIAAFLSASSYYESLPEHPTTSQIATYNSLLAMEYYANEITVGLDASLSMKSNVFSELYGSTLQGSLSDICNADVYVSEVTGLSLRQISMSYPELPEYFPALAVNYGAHDVFKESFCEKFGKDTQYYFYCIVSDGTKAYFADTIGVHTVNDRTSTSLYKCVGNSNNWDGLSFFHDSYVADSAIRYYYSFDGKSFYYNNYYYLFWLDSSGEFIYPCTFENECYIYTFLFDTEEKAQLMCDELTQSSYAFNPSDDVISGSDDPPVVVDVNPSSIEKAIESQKTALGVDDVDIVVSPGAVQDEDGSTVYSPSISIAGTDLKELSNEDADSKADEKEEGEGSKDNNGYMFGIPLSFAFPLYEQCKELLDNLFNYNDVVSPPNFSFYWDSNGDGEREIYNLLDLSFLETSLTNENMVDKGWWSIPMRIIDLLRYIIAAVIYGLFVMRLIKRLPFFYGGGYWSSL